MKNPRKSHLAALRFSAAVVAFGASTASLLAQNTWNGTGVPSGTGNATWTDGANYVAGSATWNSTTNWDLSAITSNSTLSGVAGTYAVRDIFFSSNSSTITSPLSVQINGTGIAGETTLALSGNISVPSPLNSRAILGGDLILNLSNAAHNIRFFQNNSVATFPGGSVTPVVVINSLVTGGGASATLAPFYSSYGTGGASSTPGIVLSNDNNSFDAKIGGSSLSARIAYTSIADAGVNSSLGAGTGSNAVIRIGSGAILDYIGSGSRSTNRGIELGGGTPGLYNFASDNASTLTFNGAFSNNATSASTMRLGASQGNTLVFNSVVTDGASSVTSIEMRLGGSTYATDGSIVAKTAGGTVVLTKANTYTGTTNLASSGILRLENASALGSTAGGTVVGSGSTLDLYGQAVGAEAMTITGTGYGAIGAIANTSSTAASLAGNIILSGNSSIGGTGNLTLTGGISENGTRSLTKVGSGVLTIAGAGTYTGTTTVSAGTLLVNGSVGSGALSVASGATLGGNGAIGGAATIAGNLRPGNSPGLLSFNSSLTLNSTAATTFEIAGTTRGTSYDGINVAGALTYNGTLVLDMGNAFGAGDYTFDLFNFSGSPTGSFTSVSLAGFYSGSLTNTAGVWSLVSGDETWSFSQATGDLSLSVVPEPHVWALVAVSGVALSVFRRRSNRR